jgi:uncharacterized short protein YbdD (DUF466 family)
MPDLKAGFPDLKDALALFKKTARLMVGVPDYDQYVAHRMINHPDLPVMSYEEFFRNRQDSRYGGGVGKISRCC